VDGRHYQLQANSSASRSQPSELTLQRVDLCKGAAGVVVAAVLAASESEAPACVSVTGAVSAQVDDRREVLPLMRDDLQTARSMGARRMESDDRPPLRN
jgi:hypothetical protein